MRNRATREFILLWLVSFDLLIYLVRQLEPVPCIILERTLYLIGRGFFCVIRHALYLKKYFYL